MTHQIIYSGTTCFIQSEVLEAEFRDRYSDRLILLDLIPYQDEDNPTGNTSLIAQVSPAHAGLSTFGLNIRRIDFLNKQLELNLNLIQFECIRDEYQIQLMQIRKAI